MASAASLSGAGLAAREVLRSSNSDDDKAVCLVNAWSTRLGLCLTQTTVSHKSNEITALPHVIETLALFDLIGCIITIDAMGARRVKHAARDAKRLAH
jgi:hypothetical protein